MRVAKLSDGRVVQHLKGPQSVQFAAGQWVLVADKLTTRWRKIEPYWVLDTLVVWILDFSDGKSDAHGAGALTTQGLQAGLGDAGRR